MVSYYPRLIDITIELSDLSQEIPARETEVHEELDRAKTHIDRILTIIESQYHKKNLQDSL